MTKECSVCSAPTSNTCSSCKITPYCSLQCIKTDWVEHKATCPKVEERVINEEKGRGLFTTRDVKKGTVVFEESALILIKSDKNLYKNVLEEHKKLNKDEKKKLGSLHYQAVAGRKKIFSIWNANALSTQVSSSDLAEEGVYYRVALINHSCSPNTVINFTTEKKIKMIALKDLKKGEEVHISYLRPETEFREELLKQDRQKILRTRFQFSCDCSVCSLAGQDLQRNEKIKAEICGLVSKLVQCRDMADIDNVQKSLCLQLEITKSIRSLGSELIRHYYISLHKCYLFSKILVLHGCRSTENPQMYREAAREEADNLGESFSRVFKERDGKYDEIIGNVAKHLVKKRKKSLVICY